MPNHQVLNITLYYVNKNKHIAIVNGKFAYTDYDDDNHDGKIQIYFTLNGYSFYIISLPNTHSVLTLDEDDQSLKFILSESNKYFFFERKYMTIKEFHEFIRFFNSEELPIPFRRVIEVYVYYPDIPIQVIDDDD
jgi:hypothetical protein